MKKCRGCGEEFERGNIGRPTPYCMECRRIKHLRQMVAWRAANQAHVRERAAQWRAAHREELREKNRIYMRGYRAKQKIDKLLS